MDINVSTEVLHVSNGPEKSSEGLEVSEYKVYKKRWLVLGLYSVSSALSGMQWIQYSVITDVITDYYGISTTWVDMTSMIFMIAYLVLVFPVGWFQDKYGVRYTALLGILGTTLGCWVKLLSVDRGLFWVGFLGHTIEGAATTFILGQPASLAAAWFGADQVSTACGIGVAANQFGVAIGFLIPPIMVKNNDDKELVGKDLMVMFYTVAGITTVTSILMIIFFSDAPPTPPSASQDNIREEVPSHEESYIKLMMRLVKNKDYMILMLSYGMHLGIWAAISTLLNQIVLVHYPGANEDVGRIGLLLYLAAIVGAVAMGIVLDKTHRFKETTVGICAASVVGMLIYTFTMDSGHIYILYISSFILGFFMAAYYPVGFEYGVEVTYPEPEGTVAGLLNASTQIFGVLFTLLYGYFIDLWGDKWANIGFSIILAIGTIIPMFITSNLRRHAANTAGNIQA